LSDWLSGGPWKHELGEIRATWDECEAALRRSPLAGDRPLFEAAKSIMLDVWDAADRTPVKAVLVEIACAVESFLEQEAIGALELNWPLIATDAVVAINVKQMIARRRRWALDYDRMMGIVRRQLVGAFAAFIDRLPEISFGDDADPAPLTVPLVSLLDDPAEAIEGLIMALYDHDTLTLRIFEGTRDRIARNLLIASGFAPTMDPNEVAERLVLPTRQKGRTPSELVDLYLPGTPFEALLALPVPFRVSEEMRFEHCHIVGGTGHGKTQLMQRMIHADLVAAKEDGRSVVVIDSQGDLINKLVRLDLFSPDHPESLADRLVLIDPADVEFPPSLNLFDAPIERAEGYGPADRERVLNGVIELYETFFGALLGAELTQKQGVIFRYLARLMLAIPGATVHTLMELMEDGKAFRPYMTSLEGSARRFFETEFFHPSFAATKKQILRRLWGVLSTPSFERMFSQPENKLDLFEATLAGKIILINTAKDLLKTEGSQLFGRFFIAMLAQAALERSTVPERERTPTLIYVDEAQEYFDDTIETILSQARKYRMGITLAHQTLDQLSPRLRAAFLSNTSFKCAGGVSAKDARALAPELHTTSEFIEGMRRRGTETEFAVWLKHRTPGALQLSVPLGFLESQPTLFEDEYDELVAHNRERYCGSAVSGWPAAAPGQTAPSAREDKPGMPLPLSEPAIPAEPAPPRERQVEPRELGKGGAKHRYLQALVKELAEQHGFRATIEAPLSGAQGQVDVLVAREDRTIAVEVSVTTPAEYERLNVRKCLDAGYEQVVLVLTKSRASQARYVAAVTEGLTDEERGRVTSPQPTETTVAGYKVRVTSSEVGAEEARDRRERLAKVIARSLDRQPE
jgi:uncharacterized protein DUF87